MWIVIVGDGDNGVCIYVGDRCVCVHVCMYGWWRVGEMDGMFVWVVVVVVVMCVCMCVCKCKCHGESKIYLSHLW